MKKDIGKFFRDLPDEKLIQIYLDIVNDKFHDGIVQDISQIMIDEYGMESFYTATIIRNNVQEILSRKYVELKNKKKRK